MIKMILAIGHINYDKFLNNMLEMAKQHPEQMGGMKLPPFTAPDDQNAACSIRRMKWLPRH